MTPDPFSQRNSSTRALPVGIPPHMRLLLISASPTDLAWFPDALHGDDASQTSVRQVVGAPAAMTALRSEAFDAVVISHLPPLLDALSIVEGIRGSGCETPLVVVGSDPSPQLETFCYEAGAEAYCSLGETTVRGLLWRIGRSIRCCELQRDHRRVLQAEKQRLQQEHGEADRLLQQQRLLLGELEFLAAEPSDPLPEYDPHLAGLLVETHLDEQHDEQHPATLPSELSYRYADLLRAYVMHGGRLLAGPSASLIEQLVTAGATARQYLGLHVAELEKLVAGAGSRGARHVIQRADLLALELMGSLADAYRQRYEAAASRKVQRLLPGFAPCGDAIRFAASDEGDTEPSAATRESSCGASATLSFAPARRVA